MINLLYSALKEKLPLHEIVHECSSFCATPFEARAFVHALFKEYDDKTFRIFHNDRPHHVTYDPMARGVCKDVEQAIEDRIEAFPLDSLMTRHDWEYEYSIKDIGKSNHVDPIELTIPTCWDIGCEGDGMGQLLSTCSSIQINDGVKWRTILQVFVTDGCVTRNWKESGNMYLEPSEWYIQL